MPDLRPVVMTLVGYLHEGGLVGTPRLVTLEDAPEWAHYGWTVMVDPWDLEAVTRHDQLSRGR